MPMAGTVGFGDEYAGLLDLTAFGALITNPVTTAPRSPANGARVIPLAAGALIHTGLPNPGLRSVLESYAEVWARLTIPVIVHFAPVSLEDLRRALGSEIPDIDVHVADPRSPASISEASSRSSERACVRSMSSASRRKSAGACARDARNHRIPSLTRPAATQ